MKFYTILFSIIYFLCPCALVMAQEDDANFNKVFRKVVPKLEEIRDRYNQQNTLPDSTWIGTDKKSNQENIDALLTQSIETLDISNVKPYRKEIEEREIKIRESQEKISSYKRERLSSPKGTGSFFEQLPFSQTTQYWYDKRITDEEENIKKYRGEISHRISNLKNELEQIDVHISEEESDQLLHTVEGENFIKMQTGFSNIKKIRAQLEKLTAESGEDLKTAKRYYGTHTILLRIVDDIQKKYMSIIEVSYVPKLNEHENETNKILTQANKEFDNTQREEHKKLLKANIEALEMNIKVINIYGSYLRAQKDSILLDNKRVGEEIRIADITYKTVSLSKDIVMMIRNGSQIFEIVSKMDRPKLSEFQNQQMKDEFINISQRMRQVAQR